MKSQHRLAVARHVSMATALFVISLMAVGCGGVAEDSTDTVSQEAVGTIAITGTIVDANSNPLFGLPVLLAGSAQGTTTTGANGGFSFTGLARGSYSVLPIRLGCVFLPILANLNNLTASTTANFAGFGVTCGGGITNTGATSGAFTISGAVADSTGKPVPGARLVLSGTTQAIRTTPAAGTYSFQVAAGSYTLKPSGPCSYTPSSVTLNNLRASAKQSFVRTSCPGGGPDAGADSGIRDTGTDVRDTGTDARDSAADASTDARDAAVDTGNRDAGAADSTADAPRDAIVDVCVPTTCAAQQTTCGSIDSGCGGTLQCGTCVTPDSCGGGGVTGQCGHPADPCDLDTTTCLKSRPAGCFQCATDNGCLDPTVLGGLCEEVSGSSPVACASVFGTASSPTESQVCLRTLKSVFSSGCAADGQETPCLCGMTDPFACETGGTTPAGPLYPIYSCDFGSDIAPITSSFTVKTFGAGMADTIVQCAAAFGCNCF